MKKILQIIYSLYALPIGQLRPLETEQMATTGDAQNWQMRTEVTLIVRDEAPLAAVRDITITGS